jgi:hypothetical protein
MQQKRRAFPGRTLAALGLLTGLTLLVGPPADASDQEVSDIQAVIESPIGLSRRLVLLEELRAKDTSASRQALSDLCDNTQDERLAVLALATVGRADQSGGEAKLKAVLASTSRSDFVRTGALVALSAQAKQRGRSWSQVRDDVESRSGSNKALADAAEAVRAKLWGEE